MGKRAKSIRHVEKMRKRREEKAKRSALYASQAGTGKSRRANSSTKKSHLRKRDDNCKNIGDLRSHPEMAPTVFRLWQRGGNPLEGGLRFQYQGRYKGLMHMVWEGIMAMPRDQRRWSEENIVRLTRELLS